MFNLKTATWPTVKALMVKDVYGRECLFPPTGWEFVDFRPPLKGEWYLELSGSSWRSPGGKEYPRLILGKIPQTPTFKRLSIEEGDKLTLLDTLLWIDRRHDDGPVFYLSFGRPQDAPKVWQETCEGPFLLG